MKMRAASGGLRQPPGPRSGGLRPEDPPAGGLRPGPDRIPSSRSGSCSRHRTMIPKCDKGKAQQRRQHNFLSFHDDYLGRETRYQSAVDTADHSMTTDSGSSSVSLVNTEPMTFSTIPLTTECSYGVSSTTGSRRRRKASGLKKIGAKLGWKRMQFDRSSHTSASVANKYGRYHILQGLPVVPPQRSFCHHCQADALRDEECYIGKTSLDEPHPGRRLWLPTDTGKAPAPIVMESGLGDRQCKGRDGVADSAVQKYIQRGFQFKHATENEWTHRSALDQDGCFIKLSNGCHYSPPTGQVKEIERCYRGEEIRLLPRSTMREARQELLLLQLSPLQTRIVPWNEPIDPEELKARLGTTSAEYKLNERHAGMVYTP
ncbi:hypothetical protein BGZ61DRAFT_486949 [Ilyonectria robusta]|uniref:uncharacterized protein n=1 Tax=Ilyonectria robusta TaxID=1079257 RepID=UPI001E8D0DB0|nr:uncharacterized protein BGZ61DRAFT_486949 [Ilyonectria robusta]KAH8654719.1 hypothetical protein BGZ61DRAFT_486949 [Ilyonectria robusta]